MDTHYLLDASTLVSATFRRDGIPARAVGHALRRNRVAVSEAMLMELLEVLHRPQIARFLDPELRAELVGQLLAVGTVYHPTLRVTDCRDAKDNRYLELALAAGADLIISSDTDLLVLHPWRGVPILRPATYLAESDEQP